MSKYIYNRILRQTMFSILANHYPVFSSNLENPIERYLSSYSQAYKAIIKPYIDKSFNKPDANDIKVNSVYYGGYTFYVYMENKKGHEEFPRVQMVIISGNNYSKQEKVKEISPSYIRDLDDFKHYFRICMDFLFDTYLEDQKKEKEKEIKKRKYTICTDTFENSVKEFLEQIKDCKDDSDWDVGETYWESDFFYALEHNTDVNAEQIHQKIDFTKNKLKFSLILTLDYSTCKLVVESCITELTFDRLPSFDPNELYSLEKKMKNSDPDAFRAWQKYLLDHVVIWKS